MWERTSSAWLGRDMRYVVRTLFASPGFALVAILTLALGIGSNTAIFSVVYGVLFRPLPYPDADRIALVHVRFSPQNTEFGTMSIADYLDWRTGNHDFEDPAIFSNASWRYDITGLGEPIEVNGCAVTDNFFSVLRVHPLLGRILGHGDSSATAPPVVILSESLWSDHFGAKPDVIGRALSLNGTQATIIGVMPAAFRFPDREQLWTNIRLRPPTRKGPFPFIGIGRLKPGIALAQAQSETNAIGREIERAHPETYRGMTMPVLPLREAMTGKSRTPLMVMFGAVSLVLLIAIVNVAALILVRSQAREHEMSVRTSLGATRGKLLRQLLTESLVLGAIGGAAGLALADLGIHILRSWNPGNLPRLEDVRLDFRVLAFSFLVSLLAAVAFGLIPAMRISRADLSGALRQATRNATATVSKRRTHGILTVAEVALSFTLLIGGGLLLRSLVALQRVDSGFQTDPHSVLAVSIAPSRSSNSNSIATITSYRSRYARILEGVSNFPGVQSVALSDSLPPDHRNDYDTFQIQGQSWTESSFPAVSEVIVSPGYFRTLNIPLLRGRYFTDADTPLSSGVIVISETLARRYFPESDPIGHHMAVSEPSPNDRWLEIVGVVDDVKYTGLDSAREPAYYIPYTQSLFGPKLNLIVRSSFAKALSGPIEREIRAVNPSAAVSDVATLDTVKSESLAEPRFRALLVAAFGGLALLLSAIGIYGVIADSVAQRTNEIGIRMALGAQPESVLRQIVQGGALLALAGVAIGVGCSLVLARLLTGLLFATTVTDPIIFGSVTIIILAVAIIASLIPGLRATRIDPIVALRYE